MGSWKIIAIWLPRTARSSRGASARRLRPSNSMKLPGRMWPGGSGMSRRMEREVTVFPHPDSPTMPSVSPGKSSKETPSTARAVPLPCSVTK